MQPGKGCSNVPAHAQAGRARDPRPQPPNTLPEDQEDSMKRPCTRECPDRTPGCTCEKLKAYKWQQEQEIEARRRESIVNNYFADSVRRAKSGSRSWRNKK